MSANRAPRASALSRLLLPLLLIGLAGLPAVEAAEADQGAAETAGAHLNANWHALHFSPAIDTASDEQCLACHAEILERRPLAESPAGEPASDMLAWYQTLDTYQGDQDTFHRRHLVTPVAQQLMSLSCTFCHKGNDPREETPAVDAAGNPPFTLRKMVNPSDTCLRCHGTFPWELMEGLWGPWSEVRADMENEDMPNGCLLCHAAIRTVRHEVDYLNAEAIEEASADSSDACFGCHGGRSWYRISYPYPRHNWPDMPDEVPEWAQNRPTNSDRPRQ